MKRNRMAFIILLAMSNTVVTFDRFLSAFESSRVRPFKKGKRLDCAITYCAGKGKIKKLPNCIHALHTSCYQNWQTGCQHLETTFACPMCKTLIAVPVNNQVHALAPHNQSSCFSNLIRYYLAG